MKTRNTILSIIIILMITSLFAGCEKENTNDLLDLIRDGKTLTIEVIIPEGESIDAAIEAAMSPTELAELDTYSENGFRVGFDKLFNINTVTSGDKNTKQGCMYVINNGKEEVQSGNTSLRDTFRNKVFVDYINSDEVKVNLPQLVELAYVDVDATDACATNAAINAYFDLIAEEYNDATYGASRSLTRDQFTMTLYNSTHNRTTLNNTQSLMWLQSENGSLNDQNKNTAISKLEAVYAVVNLCFKDKMDAVELTKSTTAFNYKNGGDLATTIGAKASTASKSWENNVLAYMISNPEEGIQQEMMQALVVAESLGLLEGMDTNLYGTITKDEVITLLINVYKAENQSTGFNTTTEYAKLVSNADTNSSLPSDTNTNTNTNTGTTNNGTTTTGQNGSTTTTPRPTTNTTGSTGSTGSNTGSTDEDIPEWAKPKDDDGSNIHTGPGGTDGGADIDIDWQG